MEIIQPITKHITLNRKYSNNECFMMVKTFIKMGYDFVNGAIHRNYTKQQTKRYVRLLKRIVRNLLQILSLRSKDVKRT